MKISIPIIGDNYVISYDYRVTVEERAAAGDDPGHPMEYEITFIDRSFGGLPAVTSDWLEARILEYLHESPRVYDAIKRDHAPF